MAITISNLNPIEAPASTDVFALDDISEGTTKHITFNNLVDNILSPTTFSDNAGDIVNAINAFNYNQTGTNNLNATTLAGQGSDYYLNYNNLTNLPTIPSTLDELSNGDGYIQYDNSTVPPRLIYRNTVTGTQVVTVRTANIEEDTNLYYTDDRVEAFFDGNFASYFNQFTSTFDDGDVRDSLYGTQGTFENRVVESNLIQSKTIRITDTSVYDNYSSGQVLRVYGATDNLENQLTETLTSFTISKAGLDDQTETETTFGYRVAEFDYETGEIAPATNETTLSVYVEDSATIGESFNTDNFVRLTIRNTRARSGLLVYRRSPDTNNESRLIAVLGPKEVEAGSFVDYYNFDYVPYSGKRELDNAYQDTIVHMPIVAPTVSKRGWIDKEISSVTQTPSGLDITLDDFVFVNTDISCNISHNDTAKLQNAINSNSAIGKKSVVLNAKTYVASGVTIPNNFGITGTPYITKVVKLPWSGAEAGVSSTKMIQTSDVINATNVSIVGVDFDGNAENQFLFPDITDIKRNYAIDLGLQPQGPLLDKCRITGVIGGGIYAEAPTDFRMTNCEILNSGVSDKLAFDPLYVYGGENTTITSNRFENFGLGLDASLTNKGVITNNIFTNVGSGLIIYGSKFVSSNPNVLIGPAGEFLPTPDTLNSEYDLINVDLTSAYMSQSNYTSDDFRYQENGETYSLAQTDGIISNTTFDTFYIQKTETGGEEFWEPAGVNPVTLTKRDLPAEEGRFGFSILTETINDIKKKEGTNSYTRLTTNTINWDAIISDIDAIRAGTLTTGATYDFLTTQVSGYARGDVTASNTIDVGDGQAISSYKQGLLGLGATRSRIVATLELPLLEAARGISNGTFISSEVWGTYVNLGNPNHKGIVWVANYEHEVSCGSINNVLTPDGNTYKLTVLNIEPYLSVGSRVRLNNHSGFATGVASDVGTVSYINTTGTGESKLTTVYIDFGGIASVGSSNSGTLNIIDKFVLAQGRIL